MVFVKEGNIRICPTRFKTMTPDQMRDILCRGEKALNRHKAAKRAAKA